MGRFAIDTGGKGSFGFDVNETVKERYTLVGGFLISKLDSWI